MKDQSKTKQVLIQELVSLRKRIAELEQSESERKQAEEAQRESEGRLRDITFSMADWVWEVDENGVYTYSSQKGFDILGRSREEIIGKTPFDFMPLDEARRVAAIFSEIVANKAPIKDLENWNIGKGGEKICLLTNGVPILDEEGRLKGYRGVDKDITDRKRAEEARRDSELKYRTLVEATHDFVFMVDRKGLFTYVNPNFRNITGYSLSDLNGQPFTFVIAPDEKEGVIDRFRKGVRVDASLPYETELIDKEGRRVPVEFLTSNLCDSTGNVTGRFGVGRDITKRKEVEALLMESENRYRELSIIDDLTQIYNSRYFYQQLKMEIDRVDRYKQPLTLLLLDLDDFKQFNDTYGHIEGDQVLSRLGQVVKRCLRQTDSAYRYGGEEFTILLPMTTSGDGAVTAERIRAELKKESFSPVSGKDVHMTVSIGLAQYKSQEDMKAFVHRVDQLMYQAKKNGKDRVCPES